MPTQNDANSSVGHVSSVAPSHTPGPWRAGIHCGEPAIFNRDGLIAGFVNRNLYGLGVAEANARLIAAAPELLDALRDAEIIYAEYMALGPKGYSQSFELVTRTIGAIRAAISKAERGQ